MDEGDKKFISLAEAAKDSIYSQDYLSLLARKGKLPAKKIGRNWFITGEGLEKYVQFQKDALRERTEKMNGLNNVSADGAQSSDTVLPAGNYGKITDKIAGGAACVTIRAKPPIFKKIAASFAVNAAAMLFVLAASFGLGAAGMNFFQETAKTRTSNHVFFETKPEFFAAAGEILKKSGSDAGRFAAVAGERAGFFEPLAERGKILFSNIYETVLRVADAVRETVFGSERAVKKISPQPLSEKTGEKTGEVLFSPSPAPREEKTEKEITRVREIIERKETVVPANLAAVKSEILSAAENLNRKLQEKLESAIGGFAGAISSVSGRTESSIQMVTLTQRIDTLDSINITNGINIQSGGIDVAKGDVFITSGKITADEFVARSGFNMLGGATSTFGTLAVSGNATLGDASGDFVFFNSGNLIFNNAATATVVNNLVNAFSFATSTASVPLLTFDTLNSRVGVGTTSPGATFSVQGDLLLSGGLVSGGQTIGGNFSVTGDTTLGDAIGDLVTFNSGSVIFSNRSTSTIPNNMVSAWSIATSSSNIPVLTVSTAASPFGLVGIGTTSPFATLSVAGNGYFNGNLTAANITATGTLTVSGGGADMLASFNSAGQLVSTSTPTMARFIATSTTATSTIYGFLDVLGAGANSTSTYSSNLWVKGTLQTGTGSIFLGNNFLNFNQSATTSLASASNAWNIGNNLLSFDTQNSRVRIGVGDYSNRGKLYIYDTVSSFAAISVSQGSNPGYGIEFLNSAATVMPRIGSSVNNLTFYVGATSGDTANIERVRITDSGLVGIGTTSPATTLSVQGNLLVSGNISSISSLIATSTITAANFVANSASATSTFAGGLAVETSGLVYDFSSNNVGIGTAGPEARLHAVGTGGTAGAGLVIDDAVAVLDNTGSNVALQLISDNTRSGQIIFTDPQGNPGQISYSHSTNALAFITNGAERVRIDSSGNLGIGTTTPNWLLQVAGTRPSFALSDSGAGTNLKHWLFSSMGGNLYIGTSTDAYATSTPPALTVTNAGNVGIGTANPGAKLDVNGNVSIGVAGSNASLTFPNTISGFSNSLATNYASNGFVITGASNTIDFNQNRIIVGTTASWEVNNGNHYASLTVGNTERMRVTGSSNPNTTYFVNTNVGIGTTSPFGLLSVEQGTETASFWVGNTGSSTPSFVVNGVNGNGRVGIGTANPLGVFHIEGNTPAFYLVDAAGSANMKRMRIRVSGGVTYFEPENDGGTLNAPNAFTISQDNGSIGFNSAPGSERITVNGNIDFTSAGNYIGFDQNHYFAPWKTGGNAVEIRISNDPLHTAYDTSNYLSTAIGGTGLVTFDAVGSGANFSFSDNLGISTTSPWGLLSVNPNGIAGPAFAIGSSTQCVTGDTKLRRRRKRKKAGKKAGGGTEYEYDEVAIVDIKAGDEIQSLNEETGSLVWSRVNALMFMGVKPIYKLTTESGKTIRTTGNHPYLAKHPRLAKSDSIAGLSMFNLGNIKKLRLAHGKFNAVISDAQAKSRLAIPLQLFDAFGAERMSQFANIFNTVYNPFVYFRRQAFKFFERGRMEKVAGHRENYRSAFTRALNLNFFSTFFAGIHEFSRSAFLTRASVSLTASGVDHSRRSIMSSNVSLETMRAGATTPRSFPSSIIVSDVLDIQSDYSVSSASLSNVRGNSRRAIGIPTNLENQKTAFGAAFGVSTDARTGPVNRASIIASRLLLSSVNNFHENNFHEAVEVGGLEPPRCGLTSPISQPATPAAHPSYQATIDAATVRGRTKKTAFGAAFGSLTAIRDSGSSTCCHYSKTEDGVKSLSTGVFDTVEVGGIEPPRPWLTSRVSYHSTPTAHPSYQATIDAATARGRTYSKINANSGKWIKAAYLIEGQEIAVADASGRAVWDRIVSIEHLPEEPVYDIEVEGTHNFIAGHYLDRRTGKALTEKQEEIIALRQELGVWNSERGAWNSELGNAKFKEYEYIAAKLRKVAHLARSQKLGFRDIQDYFRISEIGDIWPEQSVKKSGKFGSVQYRRGQRQRKERIRALSYYVGNVYKRDAHRTAAGGRSGLFERKRTQCFANPLPRFTASNTKAYLESAQTIIRVLSSKLGIPELNQIEFGGIVAHNTYLTVTNGGNVGVGTTTPLTKLHIQKGGGGYQSDIASYGQQLIVQNNAATSDRATIQFLSGNAGIADIMFGDAEHTYSGAIQYGHVTNSMQFATNGGNERMRIDSSGNVGIGTTSPYSLLTLYKAGSTAANSPQLVFSASSTVANLANALNNWAVGIDLADGGKFKIASSSVIGTNDRLVIDGSGNVGIGTAGPTQKFHVNGNIRAEGFLSTDNVAVGGDDWYILAGESGHLGIHKDSTTNANAKMVLTTSGLLGLGALSPGTPPAEDFELYVTSGTPAIRISGDGSNSNAPELQFNMRNGGFSQAKIVGAFGSSYNSPELQFFVNTGLDSTNTLVQRMTLNDIGNLGIGTTSPYAKLSLHAYSTETNTTLFAIASSTASATTSLFSVLNSGSVGISSTSPWGLLSVNPNGIAGPAFAIGSSTKTDFVVSNAGIVGIGTSTPGTVRSCTDCEFEKLEVSGRFRISGTAPKLTLLDTTANRQSLVIWQNESYGENAFDIGGQSNSQGEGPSTLLRLNFQAGVVGVGPVNPGADFHIFSDHATAAMIIQNNGVTGDLLQWKDNNGVTLGVFANSGRVGIGTTSPFGLLSVEQGTETASFWVGNTGSSTPSFVVNGVNGDGRVGIGTAGPNKKLSVSGGIALTKSLHLPINNADGYGAIIWRADPNDTTDTTAGASASIFRTQNTGLGGNLLVFSADGQTYNQMVMTTTGNLGIGTTTPNWLLQQAGTRPFHVLSDTAASANAKHWFLSSQGGNFYVGTSSDIYATTTYLSILNGGQVGITARSSLTSPDLTWIGDEDTGFYRRTANVIGVMTGGTTRGFFTSDGNLLWGGSDQTTTGTTYNGTLSRAVILGGQTMLIHTTAGTDGDFVLLTARGGDLAGQRTSVRFLGDNNGNLAAIVGITKTQGAAGHLAFETAASGGTLRERMRVDADGNVGIGTTSPNWLLQIASSTASNTMKGQLALTDSGAGTNLKHWLFSSMGGNLYIGTSTDAYATSTPPALTVTNAGNVGIGTANPQYPFEIATSSGIWFRDGPAAGYAYNLSTDAAAGMFKFSRTDYAGLIQIMNRSNYATIVGGGSGVTKLGIAGPNGSNNTLYLYTGGDGSVGKVIFGRRESDDYLLPNNIGISTTSPYAKLSLHAYSTETNTTLFAIASSTASATTSLFSVLNSGSVGIGTTSPYQMLSVAGGAAFPGIANAAGTAYICTTLATGIISTSTSACNPSALKYKENIEEMSYGLAEILKLRTISYDYKPQLLVPGRQIGFLAEDMHKVIPEIVGLKDGEPDNIDYAKLTAVLAKAVQELDEKVKTLASSSAGGLALTNAWSVEQISGKVNVNFFGALNLQGNDILDAKKISGYLGKWAIDEDGTIMAVKIIADELIARKISAEEANLKKLCLDDVCVTKTELEILLRGAALINAVPVPEPSPSPSPLPEPSPLPSPLPENAAAQEATSTPETVLEPSPSPSPLPEPSIEPTPEISN